MKARNIYFICVVYVLIGATMALAKEPSTLSKLLKRFRTSHLKGEQLTQQKQYLPALKAFEKSYTILQQMIREAKEPKQKKQLLMFSQRYSATLGSAYHYARSFLKAHMFYSQCVAFAKKEKSLRESCRRYLKTVDAQLIYLKITTIPRARILWDAKERPKKTSPSLSKGAWMLPGTLRVKIRRKGYQQLKKEITLKPGAIAELRYMLQRIVRCKGTTPERRKDEITVGPPHAASLIFPTAQDSRMLQMNPGVPRPWPIWQTALVVGGVAAGVGLAALGGYAIYRANNTVYTWNPNGS
ncbi:MAG: hypothetical protein CL920_07770 [Deltaproteobacteria bacterium]|nr:hypothetical protein [Deltaproteobacteria bacterium]MBU48577.1 hypothetical protein [Deltaproteobacteria bacterium]